MEVSTEKSKVMVVGKGQDTENLEVKAMIDSVQLEQVRNFTYLGARIDDSGKAEREVRTRIGEATSALAKLDSIWRSQSIRMNNNLYLVRAIAVATLLYACESWKMTKNYEKKIRAFEMIVYRRLC